MKAEEYQQILQRSNRDGISFFDAYKKFKAEKAENEEETKRKRCNKHEEANLQRECVTWFRSVYPKYALNLFHPNNEPFFGGSGKTKEQQARSGYLAKTIGVTSGVADLILLLPNTRYHGLCIELKTEKGKQRDTQKTWQDAVESVGYRYVIIRNIFEFKREIVEYLKT